MKNTYKYSSNPHFSFHLEELHDDIDSEKEETPPPPPSSDSVSKKRMGKSKSFADLAELLGFGSKSSSKFSEKDEHLSIP
ncbi:uncharacterized protein L201_001831 [Kwoniella dendrophila CBS 6074]|uniref:Uncharacterized protein n=1 Tax=Kwoniella dendrophila CBS 6074 TaxID=1295534 RepID=A0AAX4JNF8_9TREE